MSRSLSCPLILCSCLYSPVWMVRLSILLCISTIFRHLFLIWRFTPCFDSLRLQLVASASTRFSHIAVCSYKCPTLFIFYLFFLLYFSVFLLLSLCVAFNFRYASYTITGFRMLLPYMRILPSYGCGFTNNTDGRADPIPCKSRCFGLSQALTYAPAAEVQDIRAISHDAVLYTLIIVHV